MNNNKNLLENKTPTNNSFNFPKKNYQIQQTSNFKQIKDQILLKLLREYIENPDSKENCNVFNRLKTPPTQFKEKVSKHLSVEFLSSKKDKQNLKENFDIKKFPNFKNIFNNYSFEILVNSNNPQIQSFNLAFN